MIVKNRTLLLLAANVLLAMFIILNMDEDDQVGNINSQFSEMIVNMTEIEFLQPSIGQRIALRKAQNDWNITHPISWSVEPISMANLVSKISHLNPTFIGPLSDLDEKGEIPQDYGFDENSSSLCLTSNNSEIKISLGSLTRDLAGRYILIKDGKGQTIWRGPRQIDELVNRPINEWAKLTFFDVPLYGIDEFEVNEIKNDKTRITTSLSKQNEHWYFSQPSTSPANDEEVSSLLHRLVSEKLTGFTEPNSDYNSTQFLSFTARSMGKKHSLSFHRNIQSDDTKVLVKISNNPQTFHISSEFVENFINLTNRLREKRLFSLEIAKVRRIKIIDHNRSLTLRKNDQNAWLGLEDNGTNTFSFLSDTDAVRQFIHNLNAIEVTNFLHFNPSPLILNQQGLDRPRFSLEIEQEDSTRTSLFINKSNTETSLWNTYFTEQALICLVNSRWDQLLSVKAIDFKDRRLLPTQFESSQVVLKSLNDNKVLFTFTQASMGEAYERLIGFKADSFIDLSYNNEGTWVGGDWLPWKYSLRFESFEVNQANSILFNLTDRVGGTKWFAGSEELGLVCNLPISIIDELAKGIISENTDP